MKQLVQKAANSLGYQITRIPATSQEADPFRAMQRLLAGVESPIIFDVGAHHGHVTREFRELFPSARIFAFEPFPESFGVLQQNTHDDLGTRSFNYGLAERSTRQRFHVNPSSATNSLLPTDAQGPGVWGEGLLETYGVIDAEFRALDDVLEELRIPRVDLLKLDVQGAEHMVLDGAARAFADKRVRVVYSEVITQPTYQGQLRFDEALRRYYSHGLDLFNIYNLSSTTDGRLRQVDAIFTAIRG